MIIFHTFEQNICTIIQSLLKNTHSDNGFPVTEVGKGVVDVLEVNLSGLEGAAAGSLEGWVLGADSQLIGEVLGIANLVDAVKVKIKSFYFI
jgi:hypothetical protein